MRITHLFTGKDNQSHFEEIEVRLKIPGIFRVIYRSGRCQGILLQGSARRISVFLAHGCLREYVITLEGKAEIEVSSGETRRFGKGDVLLAEDVSGQGHKTRVIGKKPWRQMFITLE